MPDVSGFEPSAARARSFDSRMRARLADSLDHIRDKSRGIVDFDDGALGLLIARLRREGRVSPDVFALYYDLAEALLGGDGAEAAARFADIARAARSEVAFSIVSFSPETLGAGTFERYRRMMDTDPLAPYVFSEPSNSSAEARRVGIERVLGLMERACRPLADEFRELVLQVVLATGTSADGTSEFDGGSSFLLWGALFINPDRPKSDVQLAETLAHESGHSLLFGFAIDDPLVLNPDSDRYDSPLRDDPRPMDGIYHAAYVSARMHYAMAMLVRSGLLDAAATDDARERMEHAAGAFRNALAVVDAHGRLTARGAAIAASARVYMAGVA